MDDNEQLRAEVLMKSREAPILYVVDADARILFASDGRAANDVSAVVAATLRAAVRFALAGETRSPLLHEGRLVRVEPLAAAAGFACYAVFFERLAVDRDDAQRVQAPHPQRGG
jgi:hypothetical protein